MLDCLIRAEFQKIIRTVHVKVLIVWTNMYTLLSLKQRDNTTKFINMIKGLLLPIRLLDALPSGYVYITSS